MWILIVLLIFGGSYFLFTKFINAHVDAADHVLKNYCGYLKLITSCGSDLSDDEIHKLEELLNSAGVIIAVGYTDRLPANTPQRKNFLLNMESILSDCKGISDEEVHIFISKIFWYNQSDIQASLDFKRKYKLQDFPSYHNFVSIREKAYNLIKSKNQVTK